MEQQPSGAEIIREAYDLVTGDRQDDYSHPLDDYSRTAEIFYAITGIQLSAEEAILFMVCVKMSRLANELDEGIDVPDNTRDAIGYLGCLNMVRTRRHSTEQAVEDIFARLGKRFKTGESWGS